MLSISFLSSAALFWAGETVAQQPQGPETLEAALAQLSSGNPEQRAAAADALGVRGAEKRDQITPSLTRALRNDEDWRVRASAGRALGRLHARNGVPALVGALRDSQAEVRVVAAAALWRLPSPAAVPALIVLLRDQEPAARQWGALALGVTRDRRAVQPLLALLDDPIATVRMDVIRSIGRVRDPSAVPALLAFVRDSERSEAERLEAVTAIGNLDGPEKVNALVGLLGDHDRDIVSRVALTLGRVGDALVIPALRRARGATRSPSTRREIDAAIEQIEERARGGGSNSSPLHLPPLPE